MCRKIKKIHRVNRGSVEPEQLVTRNSSIPQQNLVGYPCKEYGRFSDKFDIRKYYECEVQPDGAMRIVHRMCPKGEEFSAKFSECIASTYLKTTNRIRRMMNHCEKEDQCDKGKKKPVPCPEPPEPNDDDETEPANEWVDISKGTPKVPNEFKPKPKTRLRIYHLHCKRKPGKRCHAEKRGCLAKLTRVRRAQQLGKIPRSYVIRVNKKNRSDEELKSDDNEDDEDDDDEEEEQEEDEEEDSEKAKNETAAKKDAGKNVPAGFVKRIQKPGASLYVNNPKFDAKTGVSSTKIILDADVRLNSAFGDALQKILKARKLGKKGVEENRGVDSSRSRRNFLHGLFSKKKTMKEKDKGSEKEALVNLDHIINGVASEFEREALLQKLEQKKNKAAKIQRSDWTNKKLTKPNFRRRRTSLKNVTD